MENFALLVVEAIKFIFPAYCANAAPVLFGGGTPIDLGKFFLDGKPIFGKNKTFKGFISGLIIGGLAGLMESLFFPKYPIFLGSVISLGALLGDLAGAFVKRRIGLAPGAMLPIIDQTDFIAGAIIFAIPFVEVSAELAIAIFLVTIPLHLLTNFAAYKLGLKDNPW
ncbi:CDP-2,3-bis-(O-geranylgeranyl)-sn-glycerol synthase [Candidatus Bathyarchaeota archaeon]|nr:CDP-2,3-bis-(O-geranylgeranyl)-sn-glycerol synthase [Candidatus Bathyarchaeota archaeon]